MLRVVLGKNDGRPCNCCCWICYFKRIFCISEDMFASKDKILLVRDMSHEVVIFQKIMVMYYVALIAVEIRRATLKLWERVMN